MPALRTTGRLLLAIGSLSYSCAFADDRTPVTTLLETRHNGVILQQWGLSCGAAALSTLLVHQHAIDITEKEIAMGIIANSDYIHSPETLRLQQGFTLLDLQNYTTSIGLTGKGFGNLTMEDIIELAPLIVPVNLDGFNHFVVFRGMSANRVLLADPAWGNRVIEIDDFTKSWLSYPEIGKVGFAVKQTSQSHNLSTLNPTAMDFVMLR